MKNADTEIAACGKLFFTNKRKTLPSLPDMALLVLKRDNTYQAICVNLELDAVGDTVDAACSNLIYALKEYIALIITTHENVNAAVKEIIDTAYATGAQKEELFEKYYAREAKYG
jgi:hypothetical protein